MEVLNNIHKGESEMKKPVSLLLAATLMTGAGVSSFSAVASAAPATQDIQIQQNEKLDIRKFDQFIAVENDRFIIADEAALEKAATNEEVVLVKTALNQANGILDESPGAVLDGEKTFTVSAKQEITQDKTGEFASLAASGEGIRDIKFHWWGVEIYLTKTDVNAIVKGGISGGTTYLGSIFGGLSGAVAGAVAGAVLSEYAGAVIVPLKITYTYLSPMLPSISPQ